MSRRTARSPSPLVSSSDRRRSTLSPIRISRVQEKVELQNLNGRLANYIDTVRNLELENYRLSTLIRTTEETTTKKVTNVKDCYEKELADVRKCLDITSKEKAKLQLEANKWKTESDELRVKFLKKDKDLANSEKQAKTSDILNQDLQRRISQYTADNRKLESQLRDALNENDSLSKQVEALKKEFDNEVLSRVDFENRLQSMREDFAFKESVLQQQITETRKVKETEIEQLNHQLAENYERKLADTLGELREHYETQLKINKDDIETLYEYKIADLQKKLDRTTDLSSSHREELQSLKSRVESLSSKNTNLESTNISLLNRVKDLEKMLEQEREWHRDALASKEEEIQNLQNKVEEQLQEYQDLLCIKVALDMEITAYQKLLEGEEIRLNISPSSSRGTSPQPMRSTPIRQYKRKRILTDTERTSSGVKTSAKASGDLSISDHDLHGKFVKVHNKGKQEITISGYQLVQNSEGAEVTYKFPRGTSIKSNATITIWSSGSGVSPSPHQTLVMKNQSWCSTDSLQTTLRTNSGDELASRHSVKVSEMSEIHHVEQ